MMFACATFVDAFWNGRFGAGRGGEGEAGILPFTSHRIIQVINVMASSSSI